MGVNIKPKRFWNFIFLILFLLGLSTLSYFMGSNWGEGAQAATFIYGILITLFLAIQIYGFVYSQVSYSQKVEQAKFEVLEIEGIRVE